MSDLSSKVPIWFWATAGIALLWNLMGVGAFFAHVNLSPEALFALPEAQQALYKDAPSWATAAFALSVGTGLLGCVFLLLRKSLAGGVFIISLISIVLHDLYWFGMKGAHKVLGPVDIIMPIIVVLIALGLVFFARSVSSKKWF